MKSREREGIILFIMGLICFFFKKILEIYLACKFVNPDIKTEQIVFLVFLKFRLSSNRFLQTCCKIHNNMIFPFLYCSTLWYVPLYYFLYIFLFIFKNNVNVDLMKKINQSF